LWRGSGGGSWLGGGGGGLRCWVAGMKRGYNDRRGGGIEKEGRCGGGQGMPIEVKIGATLEVGCGRGNGTLVGRRYEGGI